MQSGTNESKKTENVPHRFDRFYQNGVLNLSDQNLRNADLKDVHDFICAHQEIVGLDLSKNSFDNQIWNFDPENLWGFLYSIFACRSKISVDKLKHVDFSYCNFSAKYDYNNIAIDFMRYAPNARSIRSVDFSYNQFSNEQIRKFGQCFHSPDEKRSSFYANFTGNKQDADTPREPDHFFRFQETFNSDEVKAAELQFGKFKQRNKLDLAYKKLTNVDYIDILAYLQEHPEIDQVDLSFNYFTHLPEEFVARAREIKNSIKSREIKFSGCPFGYSVYRLLTDEQKASLGPAALEEAIKPYVSRGCLNAKPFYTKSPKKEEAKADDKKEQKNAAPVAAAVAAGIPAAVAAVPPAPAPIEPEYDIKPDIEVLTSYVSDHPEIERVQFFETAFLYVRKLVEYKDYSKTLNGEFKASAVGSSSGAVTPKSTFIRPYAGMFEDTIYIVNDLKRENITSFLEVMRYFPDVNAINFKWILQSDSMHFLLSHQTQFTTLCGDGTSPILRYGEVNKVVTSASISGRNKLQDIGHFFKTNEVSMQWLEFYVDGMKYDQLFLTPRVPISCMSIGLDVKRSMSIICNHNVWMLDVNVAAVEVNPLNRYETSRSIVLLQDETKASLQQRKPKLVIPWLKLSFLIAFMKFNQDCAPLRQSCFDLLNPILDLCISKRDFADFYSLDAAKTCRMKFFVNETKIMPPEGLEQLRKKVKLRHFEIPRQDLALLAFDMEFSQDEKFSVKEKEQVQVMRSFLQTVRDDETAIEGIWIMLGYLKNMMTTLATTRLQRLFASQVSSPFEVAIKKIIASITAQLKTEKFPDAVLNDDLHQAEAYHKYCQLHPAKKCKV